MPCVLFLFLVGSDYSKQPGLDQPQCACIGPLRGFRTMGAGAGDLDNRELWRETAIAGAVDQGLRQRCRRYLANRPTAVANQKRDAGLLVVIVGAGEKRVAADDAMDKTLLDQKIERAIDGDWRGPCLTPGKLLDQIVGTKRPVACEQRFQHMPADR